MAPKRLSPSSDSSDVAEMPLKRTHRTHEENQERAYIAASRRADRDIEHRIRSALKASECRKKRTGRGLKITREAVMGDEQYESEDDDPATRRFSMPATTSALANSYVPQTSRADRYAEVDALFAKHFPHIQLSSRWPGQTAPPTHRHSYPQPLHLQTAFVPRYHQQDVPVTQASPLLTPPTSYPLPPNRDDTKAGSMSPLALEASPHSNPRPETTAPNPSATQQATLGLGIALADPYLLHNNATTDPQQQQQQHQPTFLYPEPNNPSWYTTTGETPTPTPTTTTTDNSSGEAGGWHSRTHSLPSALEHFTFSFSPEPTSATSSGEPDTTLVDPSIMGGGAAGGMDGTATPPNEPWADWIDLDGSGGVGEGVQTQVPVQQVQALGVRV